MSSVAKQNRRSRFDFIVNMLAEISERANKVVAYVAFITPTGKLYVDHVNEVPFEFCIPVALGRQVELEDLFTGIGYRYDSQGKFWQYAEPLDNTGRRRSNSEMLYLAQQEINGWGRHLHWWPKNHTVVPLQVYKNKNIYIPGEIL